MATTVYSSFFTKLISRLPCFIDLNLIGQESFRIPDKRRQVLLLATVIPYLNDVYWRRRLVRRLIVDNKMKWHFQTLYDFTSLFTYFHISVTKWLTGQRIYILHCQKIQTYISTYQVSNYIKFETFDLAFIQCKTSCLLTLSVCFVYSLLSSSHSCSFFFLPFFFKFLSFLYFFTFLVIFPFPFFWLFFSFFLFVFFCNSSFFAFFLLLCLLQKYNVLLSLFSSFPAFFFI